MPVPAQADRRHPEFHQPFADPARFGAVTLLLAGVALLASAIPAWRAARVSPSEALQE